MQEQHPRPRVPRSISAPAGNGRARRRRVTRRVTRRFAIAAVALLALAPAWGLTACTNPSGPVAAPSIEALTAFPNPVERGGAAEISWAQTGATRLELAGPDGAPLDVTARSSVSVTVLDETTFTLRASNAAGTVEQGVTVAVLPVTIAVDPLALTLAPGASATLRATVSGALDTGVVWMATCGSLSGSGATVTYTAPDAAGTCSVSATSRADPDATASASVEVVAAATRGPSLAAGAVHSLALRPDGSLWSWGGHQHGQLGIGSSAALDVCEERMVTPIPCSPVPVPVVGLEDVVAVSAGANHVLALRSDGTVWAWGRNDDGRLGDGTTLARAEPARVVLPGDAVAIAAAAQHSLALLADGSVWTWGRNDLGQLGDGTLNDRAVPGAVPGLDAVVAIAAGETFSLALLADGTVRTWGRNDLGQLGDGTTDTRSMPVQVTGLPTSSRVNAIAGGGDHALALLEDGTVWTWGMNGSGQLGQGPSAELPRCDLGEDSFARCSPEPLPVVGLEDVVAVAAGSWHTLAVRSDGRLVAWGDNDLGQLGDGTTDDRERPTEVATPAPVTEVTAGLFHALARLDDGTLVAWGFNPGGQLGDGTTEDALVPVPVAFGATALVSVPGTRERDRVDR